MLATGAEPVRLPASGGVPGVHLLRTLDDAARLRPVLARQHDIVVVGAGWIGAEFATAARGAGCAVTVVEAAERPFADTLPAEVARPMGEDDDVHAEPLLPQADATDAGLAVVRR